MSSFPTITMDESNNQIEVKMKNIRFILEITSPLLRMTFFDSKIAMDSISIDNVKPCEISLLRSELIIKKSLFYMTYSPELVEKGNVFLLSEKSSLILEDLLLMGKNIDDLTALYDSYVFLRSLTECKITMINILIQKIFIYQVKKNPSKNNII